VIYVLFRDGRVSIVIGGVRQQEALHQGVPTVIAHSVRRRDEDHHLPNVVVDMVAGMAEAEEEGGRHPGVIRITPVLVGAAGAMIAVVRHRPGARAVPTAALGHLHPDAGAAITVALALAVAVVVVVVADVAAVPHTLATDPEVAHHADAEDMK
jgi:hypothetical protein